MNFNTKGHTVEETTFVSNFLSPGIHEAKIQKIEYFEAASGTPGIKITHEGKPSEEGGVGQTAETTWWVSPKAWDNNWKEGDAPPPPWTTIAKVATMAEKLGVRNELDAIDAKDPKEYADALGVLFRNKVGRWKFSGEEILGKEGKQNWTKAGLATYSFVETLDTNPSKLKFDENNKFDMVRLPVADSEIPASNGTSATAEVSGNSDDPWG
tara:strand:+ start:11 stop:643 length:633 start_codon:yes stop_codon:yes gene_type:complete